MTNPIKNLGKAAGYAINSLPVFSYINYVTSEKFKNQYNHPFISVIKTAGHALYAIVGGSALLLAGTACYEAGEINPITARQVILQRVEQAKAENEARMERYHELSDRIFVPHGLADTNHDETIDVHEKVDAYTRMGLESQVQFPQPTPEDLEKAVKSYENKK